MKKKIIGFVLMFAFLVGVLVPAQLPVLVQAEESSVVEWNSFGEYWLAQGYAIEDLPFDYNGDYLYIFTGYTNKSIMDILIIDPSVEFSSLYYQPSVLQFNMSQIVAHYRYMNGGWSGTNSGMAYADACFYTDFDILYKSKGYIQFHKTKTGESVSFQFALADMSDDLKATLQSYENYVVARVPYRVNDWQSEQIMIAVSNGNRVILRDEAYTQIQFSTGSGAELGLSYIYCSECCAWSEFNSSRAYILGDTVATGGATPEVLWTNCDIYYEDGITYALTSEVWQEAIPYTDGTEEEEPKEIITEGFPRLFEVESTVGYIYERATVNSSILLAVVSGKSGLVYGVEYDSDNMPWYKVSVNYNGSAVEGYIKAESINVSFSVPSVGDDETEEPSVSITPTPSPTLGGSSGSGSTGGVGSIDSTIGGNAKPGGGLDFIVTTLALFWTKICSIPMPVDGYEISIQQLYIYGIIAGIIGAIIFAFTRRK